MPLFIGLDLDNTIICYDRAFRTAAIERNLISKDFTGGKQPVCDHTRALKNGEQYWQALQGYVYGAGIHAAELFGGVKDFLVHAKKCDAQLFIVSHKTQFGHFDAARVDLRQAALGFLNSQGILDILPENQVFFTATREEKIARIGTLNCDVFVDDLEDVLLDPSFPAAIRKLWFTPSAKAHPALETFSNWAQIKQAIFP